jgi:hypothetical protein
MSFLNHVTCPPHCSLNYFTILIALINMSVYRPVSTPHCKIPKFSHTRTVPFMCKYFPEQCVLLPVISSFLRQIHKLSTASLFGPRCVTLSCILLFPVWLPVTYLSDRHCRNESLTGWEKWNAQNDLRRKYTVYPDAFTPRPSTQSTDPGRLTLFLW